jgi:hypothetical protein
MEFLVGQSILGIDDTVSLGLDYLQFAYQSVSSTTLCTWAVQCLVTF